MSFISNRRIQLLGMKNEDLTHFVEEINKYMKEQKLPENCEVDIYKDKIACCGYYQIGMAVEVQATQKEIVENVDLKIYSMIDELCRRRGIEYSNEGLEIL